MPDNSVPTAPRKSWRDVLGIHPAAELFPPLQPDELKALGEDIKANGMRMPVTLLHQQGEPNFVLLDGVSRLDALEMVGLDVPALLRACEERKPEPELWIEYIAEPGVESTLTDHEADPYDYVRSVNDRRRHMTATQRRAVADKLLKARPDLSDRAIAKTAQVDHTTVATRRRKLEAGGEIHHQPKRTGRDGKAQSAGKKRTKPDTEPLGQTVSMSPPTAPGYEIKHPVLTQSVETARCPIAGAQDGSLAHDERAELLKGAKTIQNRVCNDLNEHLARHADCVRLDLLARRWDDGALAIAITRLMLEARRAPDAPKKGVGDPAEAARKTIEELELWIGELKAGTENPTDEAA
jgi:hypothetical protein